MLCVSSFIGQTNLFRGEIPTDTALAGLAEVLTELNIGLRVPANNLGKEGQSPDRGNFDPSGKHCAVQASARQQHQSVQRQGRSKIRHGQPYRLSDRHRSTFVARAHPSGPGFYGGRRCLRLLGSFEVPLHHRMMGWMAPLRHLSAKLL